MATTQSDTEDDEAASHHRRRIPMALVTWAFVLLVLLIVVILLVVKVTRGTTTVTPPPVAPAQSAVTRQATEIPAAVYDTVGAPQPASAGTALLSGQPALITAGHPTVVFVGEEFCPYCAAERWALVTALSRFGSFAHLGATSSSADEIFPRTPTFSFDGTTYRSRYVSFSAVEEYADGESATAPAGFPRLHEPSPLQWGLIHRYDTAPYVPGNGTLPFVDVDNRLVVSGAGIGISPGLFQGKTMAQVAGDLTTPGRGDTQAVLGAANLLSAAICAVDGGAPAKVCTSSAVQSGRRQLGLPAPS